MAHQPHLKTIFPRSRLVFEARRERGMKPKPMGTLLKGREDWPLAQGGLIPLVSTNSVQLQR